MDRIGVLPRGEMILTCLKKEAGKTGSSGFLGSGSNTMKRPTLVQQLRANTQLQIILVWLVILLFPIYDELAY